MGSPVLGDTILSLEGAIKDDPDSACYEIDDGPSLAQSAKYHKK